MYSGNDTYGAYEGGGASQFAGGGFMPSPAGKMENGGTGYSPVQGARSGGKAEQMTGLLPVTVRQISGVNPRDENVIIDGQVVNNVTLVGRVVRKEIRRTDIAFTIDDGTGAIVVKQWLPEDDTVEEERLNEIRENTYIRIYGHIRSMEGKLTLQAFTIRPVRDANETTFHNLECIFVHMSNTKGEPGAAAPVQAAMAGMTTPQATRPGGPRNGVSAPLHQPQPQPSYGNQYAAPPQEASSTGNGSTLTDLQGRLLAAYEDPNVQMREEGMSFREAAGKVPGFSLADVKKAVDFLVNEGHLYSTVDDEHFKSTNT
eukprot:TRINITY_DN38793_c0_g1_i1.p1 TRINITY_DN38793_c0_g1~~TRINITY_DN38793_c0_g1_i1.p1  ORF type:complete len:315 (+),score=78.22 TRINITY_DN38793_c0_g1_i1:468-1412(+)